jgi:hypothetical protein
LKIDAPLDATSSLQCRRSPRASIGETAAAHGMGASATWNVRHIRNLFPALRVTTPEEFAPKEA